MEGFIEQIASKLGIDSAIAEKAVAVILNLLKQYAGDEKFSSLMAALPGANQMLADSDTSSNSDIVGNLTGTLGELLGGGGSGNPLMELMSGMQSIGLDMDQAKTVGLDFLDHARETAGEDLVKNITDAVPGLNDFI